MYLQCISEACVARLLSSFLYRMLFFAAARDKPPSFVQQKSNPEFGAKKNCLGDRIRKHNHIKLELDLA